MKMYLMGAMLFIACATLIPFAGNGTAGIPANGDDVYQTRGKFVEEDCCPEWIKLTDVYCNLTGCNVEFGDAAQDMCNVWSCTSDAGGCGAGKVTTGFTGGNYRAAGEDEEGTEGIKKSKRCEYTVTCVTGAYTSKRKCGRGSVSAAICLVDKGSGCSVTNFSLDKCSTCSLNLNDFPYLNLNTDPNSVVSVDFLDDCPTVVPTFGIVVPCPVEADVFGL